MSDPPTPTPQPPGDAELLSKTLGNVQAEARGSRGPPRGRGLRGTAQRIGMMEALVVRRAMDADEGWWRRRVPCWGNARFEAMNFGTTPAAVTCSYRWRDAQPGIVAHCHRTHQTRILESGEKGGNGEERGGMEENGGNWGGGGGWGNSGHSTRDVGCGGLWRVVAEENGTKMERDTHFSQSHVPHFSGD